VEWSGAAHTINIKSINQINQSIDQINQSINRSVTSARTFTEPRDRGSTASSLARRVTDPGRAAARSSSVVRGAHDVPRKCVCIFSAIVPRVVHLSASIILFLTDLPS
jgi:hypothetical protein